MLFQFHQSWPQAPTLYPLAAGALIDTHIQSSLRFKPYSHSTALRVNTQFLVLTTRSPWHLSPSTPARPVFSATPLFTGLLPGLRPVEPPSWTPFLHKSSVQAGPLASHFASTMSTHRSGLDSVVPGPGPTSLLPGIKPHLLPKGVWGLAACHPKANKEARLVERKVCSISDASNWYGGRMNICPKADSHPTPQRRQTVGQELL